MTSPSWYRAAGSPAGCMGLTGSERRADAQSGRVEPLGRGDGLARVDRLQRGMLLLAADPRRPRSGNGRRRELARIADDVIEPEGAARPWMAADLVGTEPLGAVG